MIEYKDLFALNKEQLDDLKAEDVDLKSLILHMLNQDQSIMSLLHSLNMANQSMANAEDAARKAEENYKHLVRKFYGKNKQEERILALENTVINFSQALAASEHRLLAALDALEKSKLKFDKHAANLPHTVKKILRQTDNGYSAEREALISDVGSLRAEIAEAKDLIKKGVA